MKKSKLNIKKLFILLLPIVLLIALIIFIYPKPSTEDKPNIEEPEKKEQDVVSFVAVGDNIGHDRIHGAADVNNGEYLDGKYDFKPLYEKIKPTISGADLAFINQESIIGGKSEGIAGYPAFNSPEELAGDLVAVGFDIFNAATNHSLDAGYQAIENSIETFSQYEDVLYTGVFNSKESNQTIPTITKNNITFSVISYTYGTNGYAIPNDYCVNLFDEEKIRADVANAKKVSDVVIVSAHWGIESDYMPNNMQQEYAQLFANLGVDLVIGTHPHVIQPLTWLEGENGNKTLVTYSLGNFLSTMESLDNQLQGMLSLNFVKENEVVRIENVVWIPLVNHFEASGTNLTEAFPQVYLLSEYNNELANKHYILKDYPDWENYFNEKNKAVIGDDFIISD